MSTKTSWGKKGGKKRKRGWAQSRSAQDKKIMTLARAAAKQVTSKDEEWKWILYPYNACGIDPVIGGSASFSSISYGGSGVISSLCRGITLGVNLTGRVGNQIRLKKIRLELAVQNADSYNYLRFFIIKNKGRFTTTSNAALMQSMLAGTPSGGGQWISLIDWRYWEIVWDEKMVLRSLDLDGANAVIEPKIVSKVISFPGAGVKIQWDAQDAAPVEDYFLCAISDSAAISHPGATAGYVALYYTDA